MSMKAPTSILIGPDGKKAFGYDAISKFGDLAENNQHKDHYFFDKFIMNLYQSVVFIFFFDCHKYIRLQSAMVSLKSDGRRKHQWDGLPKG